MGSGDFLNKFTERLGAPKALRQRLWSLVGGLRRLVSRAAQADQETGNSLLGRLISLPTYIHPSPFYVFSAAYRHERKLLRQSERFSHEQLAALKLQRLREICVYAYANCPFYRERFDAAGVDPARIDEQSIKRLPLLSKQDIQQNLAAMTSRAIDPKKLVYITTGGSSGTQLGLYLEANETYNRTYAYEWRQYNWGEVGYLRRRGEMRGRVLSDLVMRRGQNVFLSSFYLTEQTAPRYVEELERFSPVYIEAYASSIGFLAEWVLRHGVQPHLPRLRSVYLSSETALPHQCEAIARAFACRVFNKYGNSEQATIIGMCRYGRHHEFEEYSFTEYLDEQGDEAREGQAHIVSTSFVNRAMPLIRYRTDDWVELDGTPCACGRAHRTIKRIVGRSQEYLLGRNGERISIAAINTHSDVYDGIADFQYVQEEPGAAVIRVVAAALDDRQRERIVEEATYRTARTVAFTLETVDSLTKTRGGKRLMIVRNC
ncbi:MAG TPA: hypothetical protein PKW95_15330 [bacterium]|nr:hypothetical protein [bacterium]